MTDLLVPISVGELIDKVTILEIKSSRLTKKTALRNVQKELGALQAAMQSAGISDTAIEPQRRELKAVNEQLWVIEDRIREKESAAEFDARFIELARAVYVTNDRRAQLKREINKVTGSALVEEKSYADYG